MSTVQFSQASFGQFGIVGHVGCGHANSHCGFVQDDSGGLAAILRILQRITNLDLSVRSVIPKIGKEGGFEVHLASGGSAYASARRGVTPFEGELAKKIEGHSAVTTQTLAMKAFGRILGQGASEVPVALQTALANAALDSFARHFPQVLLSEEGIEGNIGRQLACVISVDGIDVSLMAVVNATSGGIGPNEDLEGNVNLAGKRDIMEKLHLDRIPTVLIEGKVCAEPVSSRITTPTFVTRAYKGEDNVTVSECLLEAAGLLGYPMVYPRELLARNPMAMRALTQSMGKHLEKLAQELQIAETATEKVQIAAQINRFASEDLGGITFMSDEVHRVMGGVGAIPGTTGCLSLFISHEELERTVYPALTLEDIDRYADVILATIPCLKKKKAQAYDEMKKAQKHFADLNRTIQSV